MRIAHAISAATSATTIFFLTACASATPSSATVNSVPSASSDQVAITTAIDAATAPFVASRRSKKFYPASCHTVTLIKPADRVGFGSTNDAEKAGFSKDLYSTDCTY